MAEGLSELQSPSPRVRRGVAHGSVAWDRTEEEDALYRSGRSVSLEGASGMAASKAILECRGSQGWEWRLTLVVAPAGSPMPWNPSSLVLH